MAHLGPDNVRRQFKGMVERCADCGFDLAGGLVEVVPTAHYMMGGVEFATDCTTEREGLFVAGEDSGGVHGANRLGGNGVANSTVFGGIAGDAMAQWRCAAARGASPTPTRSQRASPRASRRSTSARLLRERAGRARGDARAAVRRRCGTTSASCATRAGLRARGGALDGSSRDELDAIGCRPRRAIRAFNLTWHDWLNLTNLVAVSRVIVRAALAREDSRGAHFRADFPEAGDLDDVDVHARARSARRRADRRGGAGRVHARSAGQVAGLIGGRTYRDQRIADGQIGEAPEVPVRGPQLPHAVEMAQRSDACIVDERAGDSSFLQQGLQGWPVELGFRQQT